MIDFIENLLIWCLLFVLYQYLFGNCSAITFAVLRSSFLHADAKTLAEASISGVDTTNAASALTLVDDAITMVDSYRVSMGAVANRLDHSVENLYSRIEQQTAAMSRIQDADYAVESANLARAQVLQQAGTAMLAQANASTQNVLSLLK